MNKNDKLLRHAARCKTIFNFEISSLRSSVIASPAVSLQTFLSTVESSNWTIVAECNRDVLSLLWTISAIRFVKLFRYPFRLIFHFVETLSVLLTYFDRRCRKRIGWYKLVKFIKKKKTRCRSFIGFGWLHWSTFSLQSLWIIFTLVSRLVSESHLISILPDISSNRSDIPVMRFNQFQFQNILFVLFIKMEFYWPCTIFIHIGSIKKFPARLPFSLAVGCF